MVLWAYSGFFSLGFLPTGFGDWQFGVLKIKAGPAGCKSNTRRYSCSGPPESPYFRGLAIRKGDWTPLSWKRESLHGES